MLELACFTVLILHLPGTTRATVQAGRSQRKYINTTVGGLGASAGAGLDAPTRWLEEGGSTGQWRPSRARVSKNLVAERERSTNKHAMRMQIGEPCM
eukprot:801469-Pleurochrysis_carterae.AAC.1